MTGYRYSDCYYNDDQLDRIFESNNLDELKIIVFSESMPSRPLLIPQNYTDRVRRFLLKDFFDEYFSEEDYQYYVSTVRNTVAEAYAYIGLDTISELTVQNLPYFIEALEDKLRRTDYDSLRNPYRIIDENRKHYNNKHQLILPEDFDTLDQNFFEDERYLAMTGSRCWFPVCLLVALAVAANLPGRPSTECQALRLGPAV